MSTDLTPNADRIPPNTTEVWAIFLDSDAGFVEGEVFSYHADKTAADYRNEFLWMHGDDDIALNTEHGPFEVWIAPYRKGDDVANVVLYADESPEEITNEGHDWLVFNAVLLKGRIIDVNKTDYEAGLIDSHGRYIPAKR